MGKVRFKRATYDRYMSCDKNPDYLYFLDTGQLYKGDRLITNIFLVDDFPAVQNAFKDALYINKSGKSAFYDGDAFYYITKEFVTDIDDETTYHDDDGATVGAIKRYVKRNKQVRKFSTIYDFPLIGNEEFIYIDNSTNRLYTYSLDSGSYIPIRIDGSSIDADVIDVNFY